MGHPKGLSTARVAAVAYTGTFVAGSALSIRKGYPANALGIDTGNDVRKGVFGGITGAGLAAPWNLILQMWTALTLARRTDRTGRRAQAWLAFLSAFFVAGQRGEPISHKVVTRELSGAETAVAMANIALPIVVLTSALVALSEGDPR